MRDVNAAGRRRARRGSFVGCDAPPLPAANAREAAALVLVLLDEAGRVPAYRLAEAGEDA